VGGPTLLDRTPLGDVDVDVDGIALPSLAIDLPSLGASAEPAPRATPVPEPGHEVYGFVPYWEMEGDIVDHVRGTRLTTLGLFSVTAARNGRIDTKQTGYPRVTGDIGRRLARAAQDAGARVELVFTSFGESKNSRFFSDAKAQATAITALVDLVGEMDLDGIDVDVESLPVNDIGAFGEFVGTLRETLRGRIPDGTLSVATSSGLRGAAMASVAVDAGADRVFVMGYDYHWSGSVPGASAPLNRLDDNGDLPATLELYRQAGVPVERTILGLPLYGMAWPVDSAEPDAVRIGKGDAWIPSDHLDILRDTSLVAERDPIQVVERLLLHTRDGFEAVYYDSPATLAPKLDLANSEGLAGAGFWALGYERGLPGYTTLIEKFAAGEAVVGD
jgi:spore germination protein YaaH